MQDWMVDDLEALLNTLPPHIQQPLRQREDLSDLLEVVLDLGRLPEARFLSLDVYLGSAEVSDKEIQYVVSRIGAFGDDNRAGIERTLHRISAIRNRMKKIVGLTCRVGRAIFGRVTVIEDLVFTGKSILLLGRPGVGKTTLLREVARVLADDAHKRVVIVDTSNEIAGEGDVPHPSIGGARRMQVPTPPQQHAVMIEAVENHMPQVIIIDEMGTELEAMAARTIAERGVQLVGTAHGNTLENLLMNPTLSDLVGGVQTVILGDEEARRRRTQKTILERKAPPTFDVLVEIQSWERVTVHTNVAQTVDRMLRGLPAEPEGRWVDGQSQVHRSREETPKVTATNTVAAESVQGQHTKVHPFGVNRGKLEQVVKEAHLPVNLVADLSDADMLLTTKSQYRKRSQALRSAEELGKPVFVLRRNTVPQIERFLRFIIANNGGHRDRREDALEEAESGAQRVLAGEKPVHLPPRASAIRRLQHMVARQHNLQSHSTGYDPRRHVTIYR